MAWETKRIKDLFSFSKGLSITKENLIEKGVPVISYGQIHSKQNKGVRIDDSLIRYVSEDYLETGENSLTKKHDFIFADTSEDLEGCGNNVHVDRDITLFAGYHTLLLRNKKPQDCRYYAYQFNSDDWRTQIRKSVFGVKVFSITQKVLSGISLTIPPIKTQQKIADYLDCKTLNIDRRIELLQKKNDYYKILRKAIINEAVSDKNNNWKKCRMKDIFSFTKGLSITKADLVEEGIPVISYGQIHSKQNKGVTIEDSLIRYVPETFLSNGKNALTKLYDFIFADTSEDLEGSGNNVYVDRVGNLFAGYHTIILRNKKHQDNKFLAYLFLSDNWRTQLRKKVCGVKVYSITQQDLAPIEIVLPPLEEQRKIVNYLDKKTSTIDSIIEKIISEIDTLKTYRRALINEAVTGKLKIE